MASLSLSNDVIKAAISYSWTNERHLQWVRDLATRLRRDGDVLLDRWDLQPGHEKYAFMERFVKDPSIAFVLIVSDMMYAERADGRQGGAGTRP